MSPALSQTLEDRFSRDEVHSMFCFGKDIPAVFLLELGTPLVDITGYIFFLSFKAVIVDNK